ncbi:MAG: pitrilysin family protein [Gammaproteobacteria bacterium]|nr:pitrilysin family protein [Gammaproteobacteria bacterium]
MKRTPVTSSRAKRGIQKRTATRITSFLLLALSAASLFAITPLSWQTNQHVPVLFYQTQHAPMVTIHVAFRAGSAFDNQQFGLAALTTSMLNQGNDKLSAGELANQLAETGAIYASATNRDMADFSLTTLTDPDPFNGAIQQFIRILNHPDFPTAAFEQQKAQQLAAILNEKESAQFVARDAFFNALYAQHPYGHPVFGTPDTLKSIQVNDVMRFYHHQYNPENAVIVIVGKLSKDEASHLADELLQPLPHGQAAAPIPSATAPAANPPIHLTFPASQTALCLGQLGINHHSARYFPLIVGNYILGGGSLVSRLFDEVREKRGLTYGINSEFSPMPGSGPFLITASTAHKQEKAVLDIVQQTLATFLQTGPTDAELQAAKQYLVGSFPLSLSSNTDIANILLRMAFYQLPADFLDTYAARIQAVSKQDIQTAFQDIIKPNHMIQVSVGP